MEGLRNLKEISHHTEHIRLTSAEVGHLWNTYMIESAIHHILVCFLNHVQDNDINPR